LKTLDFLSSYIPYPPGCEETKVSNADLNVWFPVTDVTDVCPNAYYTPIEIIAIDKADTMINI
jgi:hypothetical protein